MTESRGEINCNANIKYTSLVAGSNFYVMNEPLSQQKCTPSERQWTFIQNLFISVSYLCSFYFYYFSSHEKAFLMYSDLERTSKRRKIILIFWVSLGEEWAHFKAFTYTWRRTTGKCGYIGRIVSTEILTHDHNIRSVLLLKTVTILVLGLWKEFQRREVRKSWLNQEIWGKWAIHTKSLYGNLDGWIILET